MDSTSQQINWHYETLSSQTKKALDFLSGEKWLKESEWYLAGGTALALQAGNRKSFDLDFFTAEKDFDEILKKNDLFKHKKLILGKFEIEIEANAHDGPKCAYFFVARLQKHPQHKQKIRALIEPAHRELALLIRDSKGKGIKRQIIEAILEKELVSAKCSEKLIDIAIHNWAKVNLGRKIKDEAAWLKKLLPHIKASKISVKKLISIGLFY